MGEGYMAKAFDIDVSYAPEGQAVITDNLRGCRIVDEDFKAERCAKA